MKKDIKISVIMTTYNGSAFILDQLNSLYQQTKCPDEVLIYDDCSSDNTQEIVNDFIKRHELKNWKFEVNKINKGWRKNFVDASSKAIGDYLFFCDQDDIWLDDKIEIMTKVMLRHNEIDVLAGEYIEFSEKPPIYTSTENEILHPVNDLNHLLYTDYPGCVYCVKKKFWDTIIEDWNGKFSHDALCWAVGKLKKSAYVLERPVIFWRKHVDSTYTIASRELKSRENRISWLNDVLANVDSLNTISKKLLIDGSGKKAISDYKHFIELRIKLLEKYNVKLMVELLFYLNMYNKYRQYLLDLYLSTK